MASAVSNLAATRGNDRFNKEAAAWDSRPFVLEIGCGTGILSFLLAPHVERIVAVDAAEGMIEVLEQKLQRPDVAKNITPLAVLLEDPNDSALPPAEKAKPDGPRLKFDLITSHLVLHHIPDLQSVLNTMLGCLAPGGRVMLTDFEDFGPEAKRFHPASKLDGVERHGINAHTMTMLMEEVGFCNVTVKAEWTMSKKVEKFAGEFGESGKMPDDEAMGEMMNVPFVLCYGDRPRSLHQDVSQFEREISGSSSLTPGLYTVRCDPTMLLAVVR